VRRHKARRQALQLLYQTEITGRDIEDVISESLSSGGMEPFALFLARGVAQRLQRIDEIISEFASGWQPETMPTVDLIIQRIGVFELVFTDSPSPVAIDEAVELAKEYSTEDAARFVNGVLDSVAAERQRLLRGEQRLSVSEMFVLPPALGDGSTKEAFPADLCPPAYGSRSLAEVGSWILAAMGVGDWDEDTYELPIPPSLRRLVVFVIDGLGAIQLREHRDVLSDIWELAGTFATSTFPSTSATGLTSICTAQVPAIHGIVGYRLLERGRSFNVIRFAYDQDAADAKLAFSGIGRPLKAPALPSPKKYQPCRTVFEIIGTAKIGAYVITRDEFEGSGFSSLLLRGASWASYSRSSEIPNRVRSLLEDRRRKLVYVYWDGLDKEGHAAGPTSQRWADAAAKANSLCEKILATLKPGDGILVTSDHGMISTPEESRIVADRDVKDLCRAVVGEPRVRYLHARPGSEEALFEAASERFGDSGLVFKRDRAISLGLFGDVPSPDVQSRIGDVIVAMRGDSVLVDPDWPQDPPLGSHGSLTEGEMFVPFRVAVGG